MSIKTITKADIVDEISKNSGLTRSETKQVVEGVIDTVINTIADGNRIELRGFGVFKSKARRPRIARNPKTGKSVPLDERFVPVFKASPIFYKKVNESIKSKK